MKDYHPIMIWSIAILTTFVIGFYQQRDVGADVPKVNAMTNQATSEFTSPSRANEIKVATQVSGERSQHRSELFAKSQHESSHITHINEIQTSMIGKWVTVMGEITSRRDNPNGHVFLEVGDGTGQIRVPIFAEKNINTSNLIPNERCRVHGKPGFYEGKFEIVPQNQNDVQVLLASENHALPLGENDVGKDVRITARVLTRYVSARGNLFLKVLIPESKQEISVPIFKSLDYDPEHLHVNSIISVKGKVTMYKGKLEIVPSNAGDLRVINQERENESAFIDIAHLSKKDVGRTVQIRGFVHNLTTGKGHTFFNLEDKQGNSIRAVLFRGEAQENAGRKRKVVEAEGKGFPIRVLGTIDEYQGNLELIIQKVFNEY